MSIHVTNHTDTYLLLLKRSSVLGRGLINSQRGRRRSAEELVGGWECHNDIFIPSTHYWEFAWESWGQQRRRGRRLAEEGLLQAIHLSWTCTWLSPVWLMALLAPPIPLHHPKTATQCCQMPQSHSSTQSHGNVRSGGDKGGGRREQGHMIWGLG